MNELRELFLFMGPPGAGKGSMSSLCVHNLGWRQLSTGNVCRREITSATDVGKQIDFAIKSGKLISDKLIAELLAAELSEMLNHPGAIILDGFPRTLPQARELDSMISGGLIGSVRINVVRLLASDDIVIPRLVNRVICPNSSCSAVYSANNKILSPQRDMVCDNCSTGLVRRSDDNIDVIKDRLAQYHQHERELYSYYSQGEGRVIELKADRSLEVLFDDFKELLRK